MSTKKPKEKKTLRLTEQESKDCQLCEKTAVVIIIDIAKGGTHAVLCNDCLKLFCIHTLGDL